MEKLNIEVPDKIQKRVIQAIVRRSKEGMSKYGVTMTEASKKPLAWITDAQEEAMDLIIYLEKLKDVL